MRIFLKLLCVGLAGLTTFTARAADDFDLDVQPVFRSSVQGVGIIPVRVSIGSPRDVERARLTVSTDRGSWSYPVKLRAGERTTVNSNITLSRTFVKLTLSTPSVTQRLNTALPMYGSLPSVAVIVNRPVRWEAFGPESGPETARIDPGPCDIAACTPKNAPDRPLGYYSFKAVILADGAENLNNAQVAAIQEYALMGGQVVACAGESDPVIRDPRWAKWFNPGIYQMATRNGNVLPGITPAVPPGARVAMSPRGEVIVSHRSQMGRGFAKFVGFNPMDASVKNFSGRSRAFFDILKSGDENLTGITGGTLIDNVLNGEDYNQEDNRSVSQPTRLMGPKPSSFSPEDPFQAKLPKPASIFGLMAGFFVVVIPINFLVLRFFKRAEWAWFTAPILSIMFAMAVFSLARLLYSAEQSATIRGVLVAQEGFDRAVFIGRSEMFFPRAGTYDLRTEGIDGVIPNDSYVDAISRNRNASARSIEVEDNGEFKMPALRTSNLAFRQLDFVQRIGEGSWVTFDVAKKPKRLILRVKNVSKHVLYGGRLMLDGDSWAIGDLNPGASTEVKRYAPPASDDNMKLVVPRGPLPLGVACLSASLKDFRPGPQIGNLVKERSWINLTAYSRPLPITEEAR